MMEIKSLFSVFIKRAVLMRKIGKMGRPPKILGETTIFLFIYVTVR